MLTEERLAGILYRECLALNKPGHYNKNVYCGSHHVEGLGCAHHSPKAPFAYRFTSCVWPGGYDILYLTKKGDTLCAKCACEEWRKHRKMATADLKWEDTCEGWYSQEVPPDEDIVCDGCSKIVVEGENLKVEEA